ncbi:MAG: flagellar basal body P-ring formation protein FlgA [Planctomycetes bacterium]|nr:flagellar basal body P-ring formation protein FlgA [Planctomycetota bacterium]
MIRLAIIASLVLPAFAAGAQVVRLRADARVATGEVRLADVAALSDLPAAAADVVVLRLDGDRPATVDLDGVQAAMRQAGLNPVPIRFCGAARCTVRGGQAPPTPPPAAPPAPAAAALSQAPTLADRIVADLAASLEAEPAALTVTFDDHLASILAQRPAGEATLVSSDRRQLGRRRWIVTFTTAQGQQRRCHVTADVLLTRDVVTAARPIPAGTILAAADVRPGSLADDGSQAWMTDCDLVIGQQVRRTIPAGRAVAATDLERPVLVKRGQDIHVRCGAVSLKAIALGSARQGEWIDVKNPRSERTFRAVVTGPAEATVAPVGGAEEAVR